MPRLSLKTVLLRAIEPAVQDRESLADCYQGDAPYRAKVLVDVERVRELEGVLRKHRKPLAELPEETQRLCFAVLCWAQQYEAGLAEANHHRGGFGKKAQAEADLFRSTRLAHFGRSEMEVFIAESKTVGISEIREAIDREAARKALPPESSD